MLFLFVELQEELRLRAWVQRRIARVVLLLRVELLLIKFFQEKLFRISCVLFGVFLDIFLFIPVRRRLIAVIPLCLLGDDHVHHSRLLSAVLGLLSL